MFLVVAWERLCKPCFGVCCALQKLHLKETGLQGEVMLQRGGRADAQSQVRKLQCDIAELADAIQDPKALKEKVRGIHNTMTICVRACRAVEAQADGPALPQ